MPQVDEEDRDFRRSRRGTDASAGSGSSRRIAPSTSATETRYVYTCDSSEIFGEVKIKELGNLCLFVIMPTLVQEMSLGLH